MGEGTRKKMALLSIFTEENDILRKKCRAVTRFDAKLATLLDDMKETVAENNGAGLACPQVGYLRRAAVINCPELFLEIVNPAIVAESGEQIDEEGCLSVDSSKNCLVRRPYEITLEYFDRTGEKHSKTLCGYPARAACHELDHLDGVLFYTKEYKGGRK